ncbi:Protein of unknown function [Gryllus bimaculatus]|nr:Protein of unknown function [Gryllus bimaculatus]
MSCQHRSGNHDEGAVMVDACSQRESSSSSSSYMVLRSTANDPDGGKVKLRIVATEVYGFDSELEKTLKKWSCCFLTSWFYVPVI